MKFNIILITFSFAIQGIAQQLPPVFSSKDSLRARTPEITTTYLAPNKVIWESDSGNNHLQHSESLLQQGTGQVAVNESNLFTMVSNSSITPGILLDYGMELYGGIKITTGIRENMNPVSLRIRFGESVGEAMSEVGGTQNATNEHSLRDFTIAVPWLGSIEIGNTGFRFVRIDLIETNQTLPIKSIEAAFRFRNIPYLGSFECNDTLLNTIWKTGAYTVQLNMQNYLWDGIKRDRLVWVGDMHPEVMTINTVFGKQHVVEKSLDLARDQHPLPEWMNGISSYSMWWILIHRDWYNYQGDLAYLMEQKDYMVGLLDHLSTFVESKTYKETLDGMRFLDWPTSEDPNAVHAGLQSLMAMTFKAGSDIMLLYNLPQKSKQYAALAENLKQYVPNDNTSKQAAALLSIAGLKNPKEIDHSILSKNGVSGMSTFYGYYILEAMAKADNYDGALEVIRNYWGGMLDLGATTFWEDFILGEAQNSGRIDELHTSKKDIHGDFGAYCYVGYRKSLCHGWASGPTPWLSQHILGITLTEGGTTAIISPHLGDLTFAKGTFPTPLGVLSVSHKKNSDGTINTRIEAPEGLKVIRNQ